AGCEQFVDETVVEVQAASIDGRAAVRQNARPRDREAIRIEAQGGHERDVLAIAAVVVARDVPAAPVLDHARAAAELIPDRGLLAVSVVRSLDLIRARRDTEHERAWEVTRADRRELRAVARARHCHLSTPVM